MINTLYIFANMGHLDELPKSGGQSSARRVMDGLRRAGFRVIPIRRHRNELEGKWLHKAEAFLFAIVDPLKIISRMLFARRSDAAFLHLTYAGPLVPYELMLSYLMRLMGYRSLVYLKGGQVLDFYYNGTERHRAQFKRVLDIQDKVFFEGMDSLKLAKGITQTPLVYFPNYVYDNQIPKVLPVKDQNIIGLIYFGRIAPNKNIDVILDTFEILCQRHDNIRLTIIGGVGQRKAYAQMIDQRIMTSRYKEKIKRMGITPFDEIKEIMKYQHFFIFPSKEKAEGHSNSLNEAMSQGLIPIVSDYHFNRSIVGDDRFVVSGFSPDLYAKKIEALISQADMPELSRQVWERVKENYTYEKVNERIVREIRTI